MKFTFGSDPEFMLYSRGMYRSAISIVPGNKHERHKIGPHEYYYDNVLAECAIKPGKSKKGTVQNMHNCFKKYAKLVKPHKLLIQASQKYPNSELSHPEAKEIGCDTEYCVYALTDIKPDEEAFASNSLRTAGGHIHLGAEFLQNDEYACYFTIRMLDLFLGIPSVFIDKDKTTRARKKLYGKAGRFRLPDHGIEYRALSNFWLSSPKLVELIYDICAFTLQFVKDEKHLDFWTIDNERLNSDEAWSEEDFSPADCYSCHGYNVSQLRNAIDLASKPKAKKFLKIVSKIIPRSLYRKIEQAITYPTFDFYKEWAL